MVKHSLVVPYHNHQLLEILAPPHAKQLKESHKSNFFSLIRCGVIWVKKKKLYFLLWLLDCGGSKQKESCGVNIFKLFQLFGKPAIGDSLCLDIYLEV